MIRKLHNCIFHDYTHLLAHHIKGGSTLLDVGCGKDSPIKFFSKHLYAVGVDAFLPSIEKSRAKGIHNEYRHMNIMDIAHEFPAKSFDCVLASDVIEHFEKQRGEILISMMETLAKKRVIIFTPCDFWPQEVFENNPGQEHKSGWSVAEMQWRGYRVYGVNGARVLWKTFLLKNLDTAPLTIRLLRKILLDFTQPFVCRYPQYAHQILCVKDIS